MNRAVHRPRRFSLEERFEAPGTLRLALGGELDLAAVGALRDRLRRLRCEGYRILIDLAGLEFIDCTGLNELMRAVAESRRDGRRLQIDTKTCTNVRRVIDLAGVHTDLWPERG